MRVLIWQRCFPEWKLGTIHIWRRCYLEWNMGSTHITLKKEPSSNEQSQFFHIVCVLYFSYFLQLSCFLINTNQISKAVLKVLICFDKKLSISSSWHFDDVIIHTVLQGETFSKILLRLRSSVTFFHLYGYIRFQINIQFPPLNDGVMKINFTNKIYSENIFHLISVTTTPYTVLL